VLHSVRDAKREALLSAAAAGALAALLVWLGPPGSDLAAHAYQRTLFLQHGFTLWNNFWYAGRYSFVTYSLLYYPLAAVLGIRLLAVATVATAAYAFAAVLWREWGPATRWSSRTFAVVWAGIVLSAAFPFALGIALALLSLWALQARAHWRFALLAALTLAASPLAFLLLTLLAAGPALARRPTSQLLWPGLAIAVTGAAELLLSRLFPGSGRFPFSTPELIAVVSFCILGALLTWNVERARALRAFFPMYLVACVVAFVVPSEVGENIARVRFAAIPLAVLTFSLRRWRPLPVALVAVALSMAWNISPLLGSVTKTESHPDASAAYWAPAVGYLHKHLGPPYRVEAVDTLGHWPAVYLARAGIPIARGWFRQDDFPQNEVLYGKLGARAYLAWLRGLGVRYVVLSSSPPDYSARGEAALLRSGRSGLVPVFAASQLTVFAVPNPRSLLTGPGRPEVTALTQTRVTLRLQRPGVYRLAVRWSPYWKTSHGCLSRGADAMLRIRTSRPGVFDLRFGVDAERAIAALAGDTKTCD
jgi:hypothetical protein